MRLWMDTTKKEGPVAAGGFSGGATGLEERGGKSRDKVADKGPAGQGESAKSGALAIGSGEREERST